MYIRTHFVSSSQAVACCVAWGGLRRVTAAASSQLYATMAATTIVQGHGLFWQLSAKKFINIAFDSAGNRKAGIFHCSSFSGWAGSWEYEPNKDNMVLIEINVDKHGYHYEFDGRLSLDLARLHWYYNMQEMLSDNQPGMPNIWYNIAGIQIIDTEEEPLDVDLQWLPSAEAITIVNNAVSNTPLDVDMQWFPSASAEEVTIVNNATVEES